MVDTQLSVSKINSTGTAVMADGIYDHTSYESISKSGAILEAEHPGKATIRGLPIDITGSNVIIKGLNLEFKTTRQNIMEINGSGAKLLNNNCAFGNATQNRNDWIVIKKPDVEISGNDIHGKTGLGHMIYLPGSTTNPNPINAKILNNKIHDQKSSAVNNVTNGYEMVQVGYSGVGAYGFNCEIGGNEIYDYDTPEAELFTIKSTGNNIHNNTIRNCKATITFRHGRMNKFNNNTVDGSGLRIYGRGHEVTGNVFKNNPLPQLKQIVIGNGDYAEEEQNTTAGYTQVRDLTFQNNYIDNGNATATNIIFCFGYGSRSLKPINNKIIDNKLLSSSGTIANTKDGATWNNNTVNNNIVWPTGTAKIGDIPNVVIKDPNATILTVEERISRLEKAVFGI